jgi:HPr kinase/phosphorylase
MFTSLDLANHFGFKVLNGDINAVRRPVLVAELDRPGLELLGLFQFHEKDRIMLIGNKEMALIKDSDPDFIYHNCLKIANPECPAIIITHNNPCPESLFRAAKENNCPLFSSDADTSNLVSDMYIYLSEALAPKTALHACLLEIYGIGVLLLGESGIGKSEISLELIKKGHHLIADDRVNVAAVRGKIIGTCPDSIYGMMEVRGIGIIDVARMFGINALAKRAHIKLVINLVAFSKDEPLERVGMKTDRYEILGESIPLVKLPVSAARSMAEIIEAAVTNFKLKDYGYDTGYEFQRRLAELQEKHENEKKAAEMIVPQAPYDGTEKKPVISMNPEPDIPLTPDKPDIPKSEIPVGMGEDESKKGEKKETKTAAKSEKKAK